MSYTNLGTFLTRVTKTAIGKLPQASAEECMRIAANVEAWAGRGTITPAQLDELMAALPSEGADADGADVADSPDEGELAEDAAPDLQAMTKHELRVYAVSLGLSVSESWTKAEMLAAIEGAVVESAEESHAEDTLTETEGTEE